MNCPLDKEYEPILQAVLFCLVRLGLRPRIATERSDAGEARISKIIELIKSSRYSIHDLSRCQARKAGERYRLNMPFELGMDFGCRHYGGNPLSTKVILISRNGAIATRRRYRTWQEVTLKHMAATIGPRCEESATGWPEWAVSEMR